MPTRPAKIDARMRVLAERRRHGVDAQHLDVGREGAAVEDAGQRAGLALLEVAADRHVAGELTAARTTGADWMTSSRTIASCRARAGLAAPLKHCVARAFHVASPAPLRPTTTVQPCCWVELDVGAVAAEDVLAGAAGRPDEAAAAVERAQHRLLGLGGRVVVVEAPGTVVRRRRASCWRRDRRRAAESSAGRRRRVAMPAGAPKPAGVAGVVEVGAADVGGAVPAGATRPSCRPGREPGTRGAGDGRAGVVGRRRGAGEDRAQRDDAGDVDGVERVALVLHAGQVDDDVRALDADVGLGDAAVLQLVADQVADDEQVVAAGALRRAPGRRTRRPAGRGRGPGCCRRPG